MTWIYISNETAWLLDVSFFYLFCNPKLHILHSKYDCVLRNERNETRRGSGRMLDLTAKSQKGWEKSENKRRRERRRDWCCMRGSRHSSKTVAVSSGLDPFGRASNGKANKKKLMCGCFQAAGRVRSVSGEAGRVSSTSTPTETWNQWWNHETHRSTLCCFTTTIKIFFCGLLQVYLIKFDIAYYIIAVWLISIAGIGRLMYIMFNNNKRKAASDYWSQKTLHKVENWMIKHLFTICRWWLNNFDFKLISLIDLV